MTSIFIGTKSAFGRWQKDYGVVGGDTVRHVYDSKGLRGIQATAIFYDRREMSKDEKMRSLLHEAQSLNGLGEVRRSNNGQQALWTWYDELSKQMAAKPYTHSSGYAAGGYAYRSVQQQQSLFLQRYLSKDSDLDKAEEFLASVGVRNVTVGEVERDATSRTYSFFYVNKGAPYSRQAAGRFMASETAVEDWWTRTGRMGAANPSKQTIPAPPPGFSPGLKVNIPNPKTPFAYVEGQMVEVAEVRTDGTYAVWKVYRSGQWVDAGLAGRKLPDDHSKTEMYKALLHGQVPQGPPKTCMWCAAEFATDEELDLHENGCAG